MTKAPFLCAVALLTIPTAASATQRTYVKDVAVPAVQMDADLDTCVAQVLAYMNGAASPAPSIHNPTPDQAIAHAFDMRGPRMAAAAELKCMADEGYVSLALTSDETKALSRAKGLPARDRWYDEWVKSDLSARIATARAGARAAEN